ncbi:hypothetical protein SCOCK_270117 [Actinacidiphila cocklensis]|uniref:Uncharacterized protein n=1 Tax=Actinacidiphila cocklensis TaxID=887465 RepID=A0A9W4E7E8_9ACTN|nr:hypothetical protein SCOCK_270117 [Actinacidiphila cocklensis]
MKHATPPAAPARTLRHRTREEVNSVECVSLRGFEGWGHVRVDSLPRPPAGGVRAVPRAPEVGATCCGVASFPPRGLRAQPARPRWAPLAVAFRVPARRGLSRGSSRP